MAVAADLATSYYDAELYPCEGTLKPASGFNPEADCEKLRKAFKGLGTDEDAVIAVLTNRSVGQRLEIVKKYKTMFGKDLIGEIHSELGGNLRKVIEALCLAPAVYDAAFLRHSMEGVGTKESQLVQVLCARTNLQITRIKEAYKLKYARNLESDVESETSGYFRRVLVALLQAGRDESKSVNQQQAEDDAHKLFAAGEKAAGTDEVRFIAVLVSRSPAQLSAVFQEYKKLRGGNRTLAQAIESEFSGDVRTALLTLVKAAESKPEYFADLLHQSMKGAGTRDDQLIHTVVTRCEVDMREIKLEFLHKYKHPLGKFISDDTSGDYRKALINLIGGAN